jgi:thioesterase domain-containing protein
VAFQRRYADSDVFTCYSYGADGRDDEAILEQLYRDAARWGGRVEDVLAHRRWSFLPHFEAADLRDGILERLEDLQGRRRTYYAGSLAAFELIECNVAYARALATRAFAPPLPRASMVEVSAQAPSPVVLGPGHHFEMLAEPHVHAVARAVRDAFEVTCRS